MVELTLLHLDVDVESVTANATAYAPFAKSTGGESGADEEPGIEIERSGGGRMKAGLAAALVGLVFLLVAAVLLRRYVTEGGDEEEADEDEAESAPITLE